MWSNREWAGRHIAKHGVTPEEAWEVVFEDTECIPLRSVDQLRYPPFRRYWTIGRTTAGRKLMVVWEQHREIRDLITAFPPDRTRVEIYERQSKGTRRGGG